MSEVDINNIMLYTQRQEQILHEFIRRGIDADVKASSLFSSFEEMKKKYEESQKEVQKQNELMEQASTSIKDLTLKNKNLEQHIENLQKNSTEANRKNNEYMNELEMLRTNNNGLKKEVERLNSDLNSIIQENKNKKDINKKKTVNTVEENDF
jgi:chromosome segregation ATPase